MAKSLLYIVFAVLVGAELGGVASISTRNILLGSGLLVAIFFGVLLVSWLVSMLGRKVLGWSPIKSRDTGLNFGLGLGGALAVAALAQLGASERSLTIGATLGFFLSAGLFVYEFALEKKREIVGKKVATLTDQGLKASYVRDFATAEGALRNAIHEAELALGSQDPRTLAPTLHLAEMFRSQGQMARCRRIYERCVRTFEQMPDPPLADFANALYGLMLMYRKRGNNSLAEECADRALAALDLDPGANPNLHVKLLRAKSSLEAAKGDLDAALDCGRRAAEVLEKAGMDEQRTALLAGMVEFYIQKGQLEKAEAELEACQRERRERGLMESGVDAHLLYSRMKIEEQRGNPTRDLALETLRVLRRSGGPEHHLTKQMVEQCTPIIMEGAPKAYRELFHNIVTGVSNQALTLFDRDRGLLHVRDGSGWTPLHWAAFFGSDRLVEAMLVRGATTAIAPGDVSPLHLAARWGHTKIMTDLLQNGADVHARDPFGSTPLHHAACSPANRAVDALIAEKAEVNVVNQAGLTPLHCAAAQGRTRMVVDLLANGAEVNKPSETTGETALHLAVRMGHRGVADCLLIEGADRNIKDNSGRSPMAYARQIARKDLILLLRDHKGKELL